MSDASKPRTVHRHVRARSWQVTLILTLFFISVAGAAGIGWWYARESPAHQGPIVLITVDGLDAAALNASPAVGDAATSRSESSALAALAGDAVVFDRAYIHSPELLPAHVSLLSGQLPYEHGVRDDAGFVVRPDLLMMPALLRNRGFSTGAAVSSSLLRESTGIARGFSMYAAPGATETSPRDSALVPSGPDSDLLVERDSAQSVRAIDAATKWATAQHGHRYFLMVEVDAAHADDAVNKVVSTLRAHRLYDGSTIVLVGDRGKVDGTLDERTLHVPMLVKQPQREGAGRHIMATVQHIDVLPTILDLVRAPIPASLGGRSLKSLLTETSGQIVSQPVYSESLAAAYRFGGQPEFALTLNNFRYVRGDGETLVRIAGKPESSTPLSVDIENAATTSGELPPLRATLDRMLKGRPLPRALIVAPRERNGLADEGVLPGLQTVGTEATLTQEQQEAIAVSHREAARLLGSGRLVQALRTLEPVAKAYPTLAAVHYQIGTIASDLGRSADAIPALERAASLRPDAPEVGRALALALLRAGRLQEAEEQIDATIEAAATLGAADIAAAHDTAVRIALAKQDPDLALKHADAVQNAAPALPMRAFVEGQILAASGDTEKASSVLRGAAAMLRQHDTALEGVQLALGRTLVALDERAAAEAAFRAELADFPRSVAAYSDLVELLHEADRNEDAAVVVATLLTAAPTPEGYSTAVRLWTLIGETARAADVRSDARARFPWDSQPPRLARVKSR